MAPSLGWGIPLSLVTSTQKMCTGLNNKLVITNIFVGARAPNILPRFSFWVGFFGVLGVFLSRDE